MPHASVQIQSNGSNWIPSLQTFVIASLLGLLTHAAHAADLPPKSNFSGIEAIQLERHQIRDRLDQLETQLTSTNDNTETSNEIQALQERMSVLAGEIIKVNQQQISQSHFETNPTAETKNLVSDELRTGIRRYEANIAFLHQLLKKTSTQLQDKVINSKYNYDNRHFKILKKTRPYSESTIQIPDETLSLLSKYLNDYETTLKGEIDALPKIVPLNSAEAAIHVEISKNLKTIESLRLKIVDIAYKFENSINNVISNLAAMNQLKPKVLKLFKDKINKVYIPHHLNPQELAQFKAVRDKTHQKLEPTLQTYIQKLDNTGKSSKAFKSGILSILSPVIQEYRNHAKRYIEEKQGSLGYLIQFRKTVNKTLAVESFLGLIGARETLAKVDRPPYPFYYHGYNHISKAIDSKKTELLETVERDVFNLQANKGLPQAPALGQEPLALAGSFEKLKEDHKLLLKTTHESMLKQIEFWYFESLGRSTYDEYRKTLTSPDSPKISGSESLLIKAESLHLEFAEKLKLQTDRISMRDVFITFNEEMQTLTQSLTSLKSSLDQEKQKIKQSYANLEKEILNLKTEMAVSRKLSVGISNHFRGLSLNVSRTLETFARKTNELKSELDLAEKNSRNISPAQDAQQQLDLLSSKISELRTNMGQFKQVFGGACELSKTIDWTQEFVNHLSAINDVLEFSAKVKLKDISENLTQQLNNDRKTLGATIQLIRESYETHGSFGGPQLQKEMESVQNRIRPLLKEFMNSIAAIFSNFQLSYEQLSHGAGLWQVLNSSTAEEKAIKITQLLTTKPDLFDSSMIEGWKSFSGYLGLSIANLTQDLGGLDRLSKVFRDLDSGLLRDQAKPDLHYIPPFVSANSRNVPGLRNFGATCYLNSITKAIETTGLQKLFSPTHQLLQRSYESETEFHLRTESHKAISLFFSALGSSSTYDSHLANLHLSALDNLGTLLKPKFYIPAQSPWMNIQQDAEEALGWILDEFESQDDSFWKIGMGRLSDTRTPKDNNFVMQWERVLSLGLVPGHSTVQALLQKSLDPTPGSKTTDDGRPVQYLLKERIIQSPDTLIIRLNRFAFDSHTGSVSKLSQSVDFMSDLHLFESEIVKDAADYPIRFQDKDEDIQYRIRGVVYHLGNSGQSGHYIYASFENNGEIIVHNDTTVTRYEGVKTFKDLESHTSLNSIANNAYLLFFERIK
jgi:ubiquitin C-terminal hydrolase